MKHILNTVSFYASNPGWHTYNKRCRATVRAVRWLSQRGYLKTNAFNQARWTGKTFN